MTLSFSTEWPDRMGKLAGKPNYFVWKILDGLSVQDIITEEELSPYFDSIVAKEPVWPNNIAKLHTIRKDQHNRWKSGRDIHMVINSRTKDRFQFAPVVKCVSVQTIEIVHRHIKHGRAINVYVDGQIISGETLERIALNDGFDTVDDFLLYFNENFTGKLIHWTDLKY